MPFTIRTRLSAVIWIFALFIVFVYAQGSGQNTNSLFDKSEAKILVPKSIMVQGEVANPGLVDLSGLPLRSAPIKELGIEGGKQVFKGAFLVSGYSLYDILDSKTIKKAPENSFSSTIDMYAIVENDKGDKAVFSWGEIYYRNSFNILVAKSVQSINPSRIKKTWPLPEEPKLFCGDDLLNFRFISNPTKITVKSYRGSFAAGKPKDMYSPEIKVTMGANSLSIGDVSASVEKRSLSNVSYGHGMGFREVLNLIGYALQDLMAAGLKIAQEDLKESIVVASAKDGYHSVFSMSEIMNRNDNQHVLLVDKKGSSGDGRYLLYPAGDFFADRDVRAVEKIEVVSAK